MQPEFKNCCFNRSTLSRRLSLNSQAAAGQQTTTAWSAKQNLRRFPGTTAFGPKADFDPVFVFFLCSRIAPIYSHHKKVRRIAACKTKHHLENDHLTDSPRDALSWSRRTPQGIISCVSTFTPWQTAKVSNAFDSGSVPMPPSFQANSYDRLPCAVSPALRSLIR